jgi:hypothetical protein
MGALLLIQLRTGEFAKLLDETGGGVDVDTSIVAQKPFRLRGDLPVRVTAWRRERPASWVGRSLAGPGGGPAAGSIGDHPARGEGDP